MNKKITFLILGMMFISLSFVTADVNKINFGKNQSNPGQMIPMLLDAFGRQLMNINLVNLTSGSISLNGTQIFDWADIINAPLFPSFLLADGTTPLTGLWNYGSFGINGSGDISTLGNIFSDNATFTDTIFAKDTLIFDSAEANITVLRSGSPSKGILNLVSENGFGDSTTVSLSSSTMEIDASTTYAFTTPSGSSSGLTFNPDGGLTLAGSTISLIPGDNKITVFDNDVLEFGNSGDTGIVFNGTNLFFNALIGTPTFFWNNFSSYNFDNLTNFATNINVIGNIIGQANLSIANLINGLNISANATHVNFALLGSTNLVNETVFVMEGGDVSISPTNPSHFNILGEENGNIDGSNGGFEWSAGNGMEARVLDIAPCDGVVYKVAMYCEVSSTTTTQINITLNQIDQDCSVFSPGSNDGITGYTACNIPFEENDGISWRTTEFGTGITENQCLVQAQARCNG